MWLIFRSTRDKKKFVIEVTGEETWNEIKNILSTQYNLSSELTINRETPIMDMDKQLKNDHVSDMDSFDLSIPTSDQVNTSKPTPAVASPASSQSSAVRPAPSGSAAKSPSDKAGPAQPQTGIPHIESDPPNFDNLVSEIMQLGFNQEQSIAALRSLSYDVTAAANALYEGFTVSHGQSGHLTATATEYRDSMQSQYNAMNSTDKAAVDRLKARGFSLSQATEAYIAMDKNEENALAFLNSN